MKNPHIIVGEGRRCICGVYGDRDIRCAEVISALEHLEHFGIPDQSESLAKLRAVITPLMIDADNPPEVEIIVNEQRIKVKQWDLSYEEILLMAGKSGNPSVTWGVRGNNGGGILSAGKKVAVVQGLIINAMHTGNA
jgi:hypothetical protein